MGYVMVSCQVTDQEKAHLQEVASRRGQSLASLLKEGAFLVADLSDWFVKRLDQEAAELRIAKPLVLENLCTVRLAQIAAEEEEEGGSILEEFTFFSGRPITGKELFENAFNKERSRWARMKDAQKKGHKK